MKKEHIVNLQCSFCGKNQREVRKLIAGPKVFICDECIGLCNQIIGEEVVRQAQGVSAESARGLMSGLVERHAKLCELLAEIGNHAGAVLPEPVNKGMNELVHASSVLRSAMLAWAQGETGSPPAPEMSAWLRPCLERLARTDEVLRALRPALEGLVPATRLETVDESVALIAEVRGLLVTAAEKEARETRRVD